MNIGEGFNADGRRNAVECLSLQQLVQSMSVAGRARLLHTRCGECIGKEKKKEQKKKKKNERIGAHSSMDGYRQQAETTSPSDTRNSVRFATERKSVYRAARCRVPREENSTDVAVSRQGWNFTSAIDLVHRIV